MADSPGSIDFSGSLQSFASFCDSASRGDGLDPDDLAMIASKFQDAAFVVDQLSKLRDGKIALGWQLVPPDHAAPLDAASIRRQALEDAARICDEMARDYCSPAGCASAIRALIDKPGAEQDAGGGR